MMGDYDLTVPGNPYMVNTARRSPYYKPAIDDLTKRMMSSMDTVVSSYVDILEKCETPQSYTLYKKRLDNLKLQKYARQPFYINQPTQESVRKELEAEARKKYYSLFRSNSAKVETYINANINDAFALKIKQWNELKAYFELVENTVEKRENEKFQKEYDKAKLDLENFIFGPDKYVQAAIKEKCSSLSLPADVSVTYDYSQKEQMIDAVASVPDKLLVPIPNQKFGLYATGKLQVKTRPAAELAPMYTDFYLGAAFFIASSLFKASVNVKTIRVSLMNDRTKQYMLWIEFDRDRFSSISYKRAGVFNEVMAFPNVLVLRGYEIVEQPSDKFFALVKEAIESSKPQPLPQKSQRKRTISVSISDARLLIAHYPAAASLQDLVDAAEINGQDHVVIEQRFEGTLNELREADAKNTFTTFE